MHATAWIRAMAAPATIADASPTQGLRAYHVIDAAVNAPASIKPSSAMLMTPERSENIPPSAASSSGVASLIAEKSRPRLKISFIAQHTEKELTWMDRMVRIRIEDLKSRI